MHFDAVNPHFLNQVMASADQHDITVSEDIISEQGVKLLARGAKVSADLYDRLARHKLSRPLEVSLSVSDKLDAEALGKHLTKHVSAHTWLEAWIGGREALATLHSAVLALPLTGPALNTLTVLATNHSRQFHNALTVLTVSSGLARELKANAETQATLYTAALLHNVGYLYLSPTLWADNRPLPPNDWRQLSAHPVIGQLWAGECAKLSPQVGEAIGHHHERGDGSGYPHQTPLGQRPQATQLLAAAELISGVLLQSADPTRLRVALTMLPASLPAAVRDAALHRARSLSPISPKPHALLQITDATRDMLLRFGQALDELHDLSQSPQGAAARNTSERLADRLNAIQRAFTAAGIDMWTQYGENDPGSPAWHELACLVSETNWQTRQLARDLSRQTLALPVAEQARFEPLIALFLGLSDALTELH